MRTQVYGCFTLGEQDYCQARSKAMSFDASFKLGPFVVDAAGRLSPCEAGKAPAFLFRWRTRVVRARLTQIGVDDGGLTLQSTLGRVPSTASVQDGALRTRSFTLLRRLPRSVPPDWQVCLLADHRLWLETEVRIALPITAAALITEITRFLLALAPYLDLLDEVGLAVPDTGADGARAI
jgi:hypothetical protein